MISTERTITCDNCNKEHKSGEANWIQVRPCPYMPTSFNGSGVSVVPSGEFCSVECLVAYLGWPKMEGVDVLPRGSFHISWPRDTTDDSH